jgi:hypothetical protein
MVIDEPWPEWDVAKFMAAENTPVGATPGRARTYYWIVIACGAIPLAVGSIIYWTWLHTRSDELPPLGLLTVLLGIVFFFVGTVFLVLYLVNESRNPKTARNDLVERAVVAGALLLANFPVAAYYAVSAVQHMMDAVVQIENDSGTRLDSFVIRGPGVSVEIGPIRAGGTKQEYLRFRGSGSLDFTARQKELEFEGQLSETVFGGTTGTVTVVVKPDGKFEAIDSTFVD